MGFRTGHRCADRVSSCFAWGAAAALILLAGCANPGRPKAPSLELPQLVTDLSADRVGERVELHWTNPSATTDKLPIRKPIEAVLCRQVLRPGTGHPACVEVARLRTKPGPAEAVDALPAEIAAGAGVLLAYRVELLNEVRRGAGRSGQTFAAGGAAPVVPQDFQARPIRGGIRLQWRREAVAGEVELDRVDLAPQARVAGSGGLGLPGAAPVATDVHLRAGEPTRAEQGGMLDLTVRKGATYRYSAERVQTLQLGGNALVLRSGFSAAVTVTVLSSFAPQPPVGLEASPGGSAAIDLSWQPGSEADLAGYNVYRLDAGKDVWGRLNPAPVAVPGYEDTGVQAGARYRYRVTAVDADGNESAPGGEVEETPIHP